MKVKPIDPNEAGCPTCGKRLEVIDSSVRVGSGLHDNESWRTGHLLRCGEHGDWHLLEGAGFLVKS